MIILGIHAGGHESSAALIQDNKILAAVAEERITRNKLSYGVPYKAIEDVLYCAGIEAKDVDEIAIEIIGTPNSLLSNGRPWYLKAAITRGRGLFELIYVKGKRLKVLYGLGAVPLNLLAMTGIPRWLMINMNSLRYIKKRLGWNKRITFVNHHLAHVASAYFTSAEQEETLSVVIEGYDGKDALGIDVIRDGVVYPLSCSPYPNSPGDYYTLITRMLGYNYLLHCGKIVGLAGYGEPKKAYSLVEKLLWNEHMQIKVSPKIYQLMVEYSRTGKIPAYFKGHSPQDLAAAFQQRLEDVIVSIVSLAVKNTGVTNLLLSGGVVANVRLNQRIFHIPGVKNIFVHPAMSDSGTALGAALWAMGKHKKIRPFRLNDVFLGYEIKNERVEKELKRQGLKYHFDRNINKTVAELLSKKKVVIRVNGRMEYGPRALGNRSILYHCDDTAINKWLNNRLRRTEFMPFAPAVMEDYIDRCFKDYRGAEYTSEFMTIIFDCTDWMKKHCPAVVHVDGTARPQLVTRVNNPDFYAILEQYHGLTGNPVLINTSYNIHDEPIVRSEADAIRVFKLTCLDYMAIGDYLVSAQENGLIWNEDNSALPSSQDTLLG